MDAAVKAGLDGVCITDHDTMAVRNHMREGMQDNGLCMIFGMEYETADGHFLLFGPYEGLSSGLDAPALLKLVRQTGGAAVAAHPFRAGMAVREDIFKAGICHMAERINGRNTEAENLKAAALVRRYGLTALAGSDAHTSGELGKAPTIFDMPILSRSDLIFALNNGLCRPDVPAFTPRIEAPNRIFSATAPMTV